jgi:hypothetical protein
MHERPAPRFRATAALRRGLGTFVESLGPLLVIAAVPAIPMLLFTGLVATSDLTPDVLEIWQEADFWLGTLATALTTACVAHGLLTRRPGEPLRAGASLGGGLRAAWSALGVTVLGGLALVVGTLLLVVPGLIVLAITFIAIPAAVTEGMGAVAALGRSRELTRDRRLAVLAVVLVDYAVVFAVVAATTAASEIHATSVIQDGGDPHLTQIGWMFVTVASGAALSALGACLATATYLDLRLDKEGPPPDDVARVFA